jgi:L-fuculose-phosphate aldolase
MNETEHLLRSELIRINRILALKGLICSSDSNISVRLNKESLLITPSGLYKSTMLVDDLIVINMNGDMLQGKEGSKPTSETPMHLEVYRVRPDVNAIIHAHPPYSTALTITGKPFPVEYLPEVLLALGDVPTADYATPGTQAMADSIHDLVQANNCILLSHHGSLTIGHDLEEALIAVERMEQAAFTHYLSLTLGVPIPLPQIELDNLRKIGNRLRIKQKNSR